MVHDSLRASTDWSAGGLRDRGIFSENGHGAETPGRCLCVADPDDDCASDLLRDRAGNRVDERPEEGWHAGPEDADLFRNCFVAGADDWNCGGGGFSSGRGAEY